MDKYSATVLCKKQGIDRNVFWEEAIKNGLLSDKQTPTEAGCAAGIELATAENGNKYPIYPENIIKLVFKEPPIQLMSINEYCHSKQLDPSVIRTSLLKRDILTIEDGKIMPGRQYASIGAKTSREKDAVTGKDKYVMRFPIKLLNDITPDISKEQPTKQEPENKTQNKPEGKHTSSRLSESKIISTHPDLLETPNGHITRKSITKMLEDNGIISKLENGKRTVGPNADIVKAKLVINDEKRFSYITFDEDLLISYIKDHSTEIPAEPPKSEKTSKPVRSSLPSIPEDATLVCFDTETTGFSAKEDDLLQITVIKGTMEDFATNNQEIVISTYVRPEKHDKWPEAEAVNHISPDVVFAYGIPELKDIKDNIIDTFKEADFIVGHNITFDANFIKEKFGYWIPANKRIDTLKLAKDLLPELRNHKLYTVVEELLPDKIQEFTAGAHDAKTDTIFTAKTLAAIATRFPDIIVKDTKETQTEENTQEEVEFG